MFLSERPITPKGWCRLATKVGRMRLRKARIARVSGSLAGADPDVPVGSQRSASCG